MGILGKFIRLASRMSLCLIGVLAFCAWPVGGPVGAQDVTAEREYRLKAAFLYNFAKFVDWPDDTFVDGSSPMVFCIIGEDPFGGSLEELVENKRVKGRTIIVYRANRLNGHRKCHVMFVTRSRRAGIGDIFNALAGSDILTVGDMDRFAHNGGMINMVRKKNKIRFEVNQSVISRTRLKMSSKLLNLADIVE